MLRQMPFMPTCHRAALCHSCRLCLSLALCTMAREPRTCMPLVLVTVIKLCSVPGRKGANCFATSWIRISAVSQHLQHIHPLVFHSSMQLLA